MKKKLEIAVGQMNSVDDVDRNLEQIENLIGALKNPETVDLISFPENSLYMRIVEGEKIDGLELSHPAFRKLEKLATRMNLNFHLGSVALKHDNKLWNASIWIEKSKPTRVTYKKIHLFDLDLAGHKPVRESDVYAHGYEPQTLDFEGWKIGQSICYDMRFAELYSHYVSIACEALLIPSSFLVPTGKVHWEILLRARAIESQCYVIAAAQAGTHKSTKGLGERETYGHSLVVDPWGEVLCKGAAQGPQILQFTMDFDRVQKIRQQIPMHRHRRLITLKS